MSRWLVGSSSSSRSERHISARATLMRTRQPPEKVADRPLVLGVREAQAMHELRGARAARRSRRPLRSARAGCRGAHRRRARWPPRSAPRSRAAPASPSSTNSIAGWSVASISCETCAMTRFEGISKLPPSACTVPRTSSSSVDLPLPFSPVMPIFSPRNRLKVAPANSTRGPRRTARSVKLSIAGAPSETYLHVTASPSGAQRSGQPLLRQNASRPISRANCAKRGSRRIALACGIHQSSARMLMELPS